MANKDTVNSDGTSNAMEAEVLAENFAIGVKMIDAFAHNGYEDFGLFVRVFAFCAPEIYHSIRNYIPRMWMEARRKNIKLLDLSEKTMWLHLRVVDSVLSRKEDEDDSQAPFVFEEEANEVSMRLIIQILNLLPANKEAEEALHKMGERLDPEKLAIINYAETKANSEDLVSCGRDDLNIYIPEMTSGEDLLFDLIDIDNGLTPNMARRKRQ